MKFRFANGKKTEQITVKTDQVAVIRRRRVTKSWCGQCQDNAEFIPLEDINRVIDSGTIPSSSAVLGGGFHFGKAADGSVVVCAKLLVKKP